VDREVSIGVADQDYSPACIPSAVNLGSASPTDLGTLRPGQSAHATYRLKLRGDGTILLSTLAEAGTTGHIVRAVGKTDLPSSTRLLYWSAEMGRQVRSPETPELIAGGATWTIRLHLQDRSCAQAIALLPMYRRSVSGNAADGHVQIDGLPIEQIDDTSARASDFELFEPRQSKTLEMIIQTYRSDAASSPVSFRD
jgi:hypothetical protein